MKARHIQTLCIASVFSVVAGTPVRKALAEGPAPAPPPARVVEVDVRAQHLADRPRSPGLAALLSLTPAPIDFGNFYAENVDWGLAYTSGELLLGGAMMWIGASHMCHHGPTSECSSWSMGERNTMIGLAGGYVALKIVAAFEASSAARRFNEQRAPQWMPMVGSTNGGAIVGWGAQF